MSAFADEDEEYEEISDEEKLRIATHFLLSCPPGELKDLTVDVKKIVPDSVLTSDALQAIYRTYNMEQHVMPTLSDGPATLVCKHSEASNGNFVNPRDGKVYGFDHVEQAWKADEVDAAPSNMDASIEAERAAVQSALEGYVSKQYHGSDAASNSVGVYSKEGKLHIAIIGQATNLRNWWSGSWRGSFVVELAGGSARVTGEISLLAHYFEDGNVQMSTQKDCENDGVAYSDAASLGEAIVDLIRGWEHTLQNGLETMYIGMSNQTFKDMRRILPVTKTKFDWSGAAMKLAGGAGHGSM